MMKKFLYSVLFLMFGFALQAQTPYPTPYQTIGGTSPKTAGKVKGGIFIDSTLVIPHYDDTLSATLGVTSLYNSLIQVGDQNVYYKRVGNKWVSIEEDQIVVLKPELAAQTGTPPWRLLHHLWI